MLAEQVLELRMTPAPELVFAAGAIAELPALVRRFGSRAFVVTDAGLEACGIAGRVRDLLEAEGIETAVHARIGPNPSTDDVEAGATALRAFGEAVVVGLGGGSPIDAAKGVALLAVNDGRARDLDYRATPAHPARPLIAVPTTAGTGAETNAFGVIGDHERGEKIYVGHASAQPRVALLDPELTLGLPPRVTAATGLDVLVHAVECLQARTANPFATGLALEVVRTVGRWLPVAVERGGDLAARGEMLLAAHLATLAFGSGTGLGTAHAIGHALSDRHRVAHGEAMATVFPLVVRMNAVERPGPTARALAALGAEGELEDAVDALQRRIGMRPTLTDVGVGAGDLEAIADQALADVVIQNAPRIPSRDELLALLREAL